MLNGPKLALMMRLMNNTMISFSGRVSEDSLCKSKIEKTQTKIRTKFSRYCKLKKYLNAYCLIYDTASKKLFTENVKQAPRTD